MMSSKVWIGKFSTEGLNQWASAIETGKVDLNNHQDALREGLVVNVDGGYYALRPDSSVCGGIETWLTCVQKIRGGVELDVADPAPPAGVEFGVVVPTPAAKEVEAPAAPEPVLQAPPVPCAEVSPALPEPPSSESADSIPRDQLIASVEHLTGYHVPLRPALRKLIDAGASQTVVETAIALSDVPHHMARIGLYGRVLTRKLAQLTQAEQSDLQLMDLVQDAYNETLLLNMPSRTEAEVFAEVMKLVPDVQKERYRSEFERQASNGESNYWAEAWDQVQGAIAEHRTDTPVNLFRHIVQDLIAAAALAAGRDKPSITANECEWLWEYLPTPEHKHPEFDELLGRAFYIPRMKEAINRAHSIPFIYVMVMMLDNEYATDVLRSAHDTMLSLHPALSRITSRGQFEYAFNLLAATLIDRASRAKQSWDETYGSPVAISTSLFHHAVFDGARYIKILQDYMNAGASWMTEATKKALVTLLEDQEAMDLLQKWEGNHNPWSFGSTPEKAYDAYQESILSAARQHEYADRQRAAAQEAHAAQLSLLQRPMSDAAPASGDGDSSTALDANGSGD